MTNFVKLWMKENYLEIGDWFKLKYGNEPMHVTDEYKLLDAKGNEYNYTLNQLLAGNYTIIKLKTKLTKEQYTFINSFEEIDSFHIYNDGCVNCLILKDTSDYHHFVRFDLVDIKIRFDNLEQNKTHKLSDCEVEGE